MGNFITWGDIWSNTVALSGDGTRVAIGKPFENCPHGVNRGTVELYELSSGDTWTQIGEEIDGDDTMNYSGYSVSISYNGTIVAIGAYNHDRTESGGF